MKLLLLYINDVNTSLLKNIKSLIKVKNINEISISLLISN